MNGATLRKTLSQESAAPAYSETLPSRMEDFWDEPAMNGNAVEVACKEVQGAWFFKSGRREAEFLISGNRFTIRFSDGEIYMGAFELNPTAVPKRMEMHIDEGPVRHKGKTALCIYELEGGTLRWCAPNPGLAERLAGFPTEDAPQYLCLLFQREQVV